MKTTKKVVTTANLNTGTEQIISLHESSIEEGQTVTRNPSNIKFDNNTNAVIGIIYLDDDNEKDVVRAANASLYEFLPLESGQSTGILPDSIQYLIVKKLSGTATADLNIYPHNYFKIVSIP